MKFSVIVPVYNVEQYLPACMDSLLCQQCESFEIILVDDGSADGSGKLCDAYATEHPELIRVIHQENGGLGAARNTGVAHAAGEYLLFLDSDDTLTGDALRVLEQATASDSPELVIFGYRYVTQHGELPGEPRLSEVTGKPQTLKDSPALLLDSPSACFRLWHRSLFADGSIRFPGRVWYEDLCTTPKALLRARSIVQLDAQLYRYLLRPGSIMRSDDLRRNLEILNALETVRVFYEAQGALERYRPWLSTLAVDSVLAAARRVLTADPRADYLPEFVGYLQTRFPDCRGFPELRLLGRKKLILLRLLEGRHYRTAKAIFSLTAKLHR